MKKQNDMLAYKNTKKYHNTLIYNYLFFNPCVTKNFTCQLILQLKNHYSLSRQ